MPTCSIPNVRLAGLAAAVPTLQEISWDELPTDRCTVARRRKEIPFRRKARSEQCQSDFCVEAAQRLLNELGWQPAEIDFVVMATLTPDYPIPATAIIVQDRLGIPKTAAAFDLPSGSIGFVHGLQLVASMLSSGHLKKALLLTGEVSKNDESSDGMRHGIVVGHSGSVCALEHSPGAAPIVIDAGGDGAAFEALYMPVGGVRNPPSPDMFNDPEGVRLASEYALDASAVARTSVAELPASIRRVLAHAERAVESVDGFYFNPGALPAERAIRNELGISMDRFHSTIPEFGASGSGSIPLALLARNASRLRRGDQRVMCSSIGAGLAWATALLETRDVCCPEIIEA